jgi:hypothetical protein
MGMNDPYTITAGDTEPLVAFLKRANDKVFVLPPGTLVYFTMLPQRVVADGILAGAAEILDGPAGKVRYVPLPGQTDVPGVYDAKWKVVLPDGSVKHVPNDEPDVIRIVPALT